MTSFRLDPGSGGGQIFNCLPGRALGGGAATEPASLPLAEMAVNSPLDSTGTTATTTSGQPPAFWNTNFLNDTTFSREYRAYGICSSNSDATIQAGAPVIINANQLGQQTIDCPAGTRAIGGGVGTTENDPTAQIQLTAPLDATGSTVGTVSGDVPGKWFTSLLNGPGATRTYRFFAVCSAGSDAIVAARDLPITGFFSDGAAVPCPAGYRAVSGGVSHTEAVPVTTDLRGSHPVDETQTLAATTNGDVARGWRSDVLNYAGTVDYRFYAVCVTDPTPAQSTNTPAPPVEPKKKCKKRKGAKRKKGKRCKKKKRG
jgi:hypothetical protein